MSFQFISKFQKRKILVIFSKFTSFNGICIVYAMFTHLVNPSRTQIELIYVFIRTKKLPVIHFYYSSLSGTQLNLIL